MLRSSLFYFLSLQQHSTDKTNTTHCSASVSLIARNTEERRKETYESKKNDQEHSKADLILILLKIEQDRKIERQKEKQYLWQGRDHERTITGRYLITYFMPQH